MPIEDQPHQPETQHYPEVISRQIEVQAPDQPEVVTDLTHTPEDYLELEQESREMQQALALEFDLWASELPDQQVREQAAPFVAQMNEQRPNDPVDIQTASRQFLQHMIRPKWDELFPKDDSPEEQQKWQEFVDQWPPHMQSNLEELLVVDAELREQTRDLDIMRGVTEIRAERLEVMRAASGYVGAERTLQKLSGQAAMVRSCAALTNRGLTRADRKQLEHIGEQQAAAEARKNSIVTSPEIVTEIQRRREIKDSRDLQKGILLTEQMQDTIDYVLPSLAAGRPVLLVGETGGAKTALAEFISTEYFDKVPEIISGNTDVNSYQLMGKMRLRPADSWTDEDLKEAMDQIIKEDQYDHVTPEVQARVRTKAIERVLARSGSVSDFIPGPVIRAMEEGKPLILDEVNAIQPEFIKRLNKIMQLRPGQTYIPQEDSGRSVVVKPGFCIIATANEKSKRYKGVDDLSVELLNRFGANIVRVPYPDGKVPDGQPPKDNLRLALAFLRDRSGVIDPDIDLAEVALFVKAAHVTQKLFTGSEVPSYINTTTVRDGLKDAVIAPRTMVDILAKVKEGHSLNDTLSHFVSGLKNESDRQAIKEILEQHNFEIGTAQEA